MESNLPNSEGDKNNFAELKVFAPAVVRQVRQVEEVRDFSLNGLRTRDLPRKWGKKKKNQSQEQR